jgi:hypothetical protein
MSQLGLADQLLYIIVISYIVNCPLYTISFINHCYICYASPPLRPIEGVRGIYLF